ncbi:MAG: hypothetical protein GY796_17260 [Chloroflexi bacterium]|nr:hypothetical protein [Chloroflexota bacterium]
MKHLFGAVKKAVSEATKDGDGNELFDCCSQFGFWLTVGRKCQVETDGILEAVLQRFGR